MLTINSRTYFCATFKIKGLSNNEGNEFGKPRYLQRSLKCEASLAMKRLKWHSHRHRHIHTPDEWTKLIPDRQWKNRAADWRNGYKCSCIPIYKLYGSGGLSL